MKKHYSITRGLLKGLAVVALAMGFSAAATAQDTYRKSWDFTKGISDETKANLVADSNNWKDSGEPSATDANDRNTISTWTNSVNFAVATPIKANDIVVDELDGITFPEVSGWKNGGDIRLGEQHPDIVKVLGNDYSQRFRLCRANITFQLPSLEAGQKIHIVWSSSAPSDKGGGRYITSEQCDATDGAPAEGKYEDLKVYEIDYIVKDTYAEPTPIIFKSSNGVDIYSITIDGGDGGQGEEDTPILVVSPEGEDDSLYFALQDGFASDFVKTFADIEEGKTLADYKAIVISNKVTADNVTEDAPNGELREALAFYPMVNLSAQLIKAWGLGTVADSGTKNITVSDANLSHKLFTELPIEEGLLELVAEGVLPVVTPGEYLAKDDVLATAGETAYILQHNAGRNTHILIPLSTSSNTEGENLVALVRNAASVAAKTQKPLTSTSKPTFSADQGNNETTVTITATNADAIYYSLGNDSDPKKNGQLYTVPIKFTKPTMIKAYATQDGYDPSDVATYEVAISAKAEKPVIEVKPGEGKSAIITITPEEVDGEVHFSFAGQAESSRTDAAKTEVYSGPITVTEPTTVYAFTTGADLLPSELESAKVNIPGLDASNIRLDVESHFYVGNNAWIEGTSAQYLGMNGDGEFGVSGSHKNAWHYYLNEKEDVKDKDGNTVYEEDGVTAKQTFKIDPNSYHEVLGKDAMADWKLVSENSTLAIEPNTGTDAWITGDKDSGYAHAIEMIDIPATKGVLSWKNVLKDHDGSNNEPVTARVESTRAFTAPFDVVVYVKNSSSDKESSCKLYISKDGKEWTSVKDSENNDVILKGGPTQRQVARTRVSIEDEGSYFVRVGRGSNSPALHDIYIYNHGKESEKYSGIEDVIANEGAEVIAVEYYNLGGIRIAEPTEGFFIKRSTLSNGQVLVEKLVK